MGSQARGGEKGKSRCDGYRGFFPFLSPFVFTNYPSHASLSENRDKFTKYGKKLYKLPAEALRTSLL